MEKLNLTDRVEIKIYMSSEKLPEDLVRPSQKHTKNVIEVITGIENLTNCDGLVTKQKGLEIGVRTADCAPICITDEAKVGIIHTGWRGLCLGVIEEGLKYFSSNPKIYIGPHMHSFEIQKDECYDMIKSKFGDEFFSQKKDKLTFNFTSALLSLLPTDVRIDERDTYLDTSFPSFRRDKTEERFITSIVLI